MVNKDCTEIKLPAEIMKAGQPLTIVLAGPGLEQVAALLRKMFRRASAPVFYIANYRVAWQKVNTDRVKAAMEQGGQYVAQRTREASVPPR